MQAPEFALFLAKAFKLTVPDMKNKILSTPAAVISVLTFPILIALGSYLERMGCCLSNTFFGNILLIAIYPILLCSPIAGLLIAVYLIYKRKSVSAALLFVVLFGLFELWFITNIRIFG